MDHRRRMCTMTWVLPAETLLVEEGTLEQEPGSGIRGIVDGTPVAVGTLDWLHRHGASLPAPDGALPGPPPPGSSATGGGPTQGTAQSRLTARSGHTRVYVGIGDRVAAYIDMSDELRPGAAETVAALRTMGISSVLLSGER